MPGRVLCMDKRYWWILEMPFLISLIVFEIATLGAPRWFRQGTHPYDWEGGVINPSKDSFFYPDSMNYKELADECQEEYLGQGTCDMFRKLWLGGVVYILFECLSIALVIASCLILFIDICNKRTVLWLTTFFMWIAVAAHFIGFIVWSRMAKLNFDKECNERNQDNGDTAENVCAKEGAALALFLMLYIGLITIFHTIIYCRAKHNIAKDRERENRRDNQFKPPSEPSEPSVSITDSMQRDVSDVKIEVDTKPKKKKHKKQHSESSES